MISLVQLCQMLNVCCSGPFLDWKMPNQSGHGTLGTNLEGPSICRFWSMLENSCKFLYDLRNMCFCMSGPYISEGKSSERTNQAGVCAHACCCTSSAASLHHQYSGFLLQCRHTFLLLFAGSTVTAGESFDCFSNFASDTFHGLDFLIWVIMRLYEWCCSLHPTIHRHWVLWPDDVFLTNTLGAAAKGRHHGWKWDQVEHKRF